MKRVLARVSVLVVLVLGLSFVSNPTVKSASGCQTSCACCKEACADMYWDCVWDGWNTDCDHDYNWCMQGCGLGGACID